MIQKIRKMIMACMAVAALLLSVLPQTAVAHGEKATEPSIRTRSVHWYDLTWSTEKLQVNDTVTMQGKFRLMNDWPDAVAQPSLVFLSTGGPSAVLTRVETYINGLPAQQSFKKMELGRDYDFKIVMKGRIPGNWHLHPVLNVHNAGPIIGPGAWVTVDGNAAAFKEPIKTMTGLQIDDSENYGVARAQMWQAGYALIAVAWLIWWLRRPLLISRWRVLQKGREDLLLTRTDDKVAAGVVVLLLVVVIVGYIKVSAEFPQLVPLQGGTVYTEPLPEAPRGVAIKLKRAEYDVPGRSMRLSVEMTNNTDQPLGIGEFTTANLRFINKMLPQAVAAIDPKYPKELMPGNGLVVDSNAPLAPGEKRVVMLDTTDVAWEVERLVSFLTNVDSRTGGLIFFYDPQGKRYISEVAGSILPVFKKTI
ncbi:MAG: methane monooxygenase/ammonia monooxygenase subunit B [Comamonadaceae bacterium]|nr:methane monooxygenase/ammonia monooxygenase subunit B [Comamonadaceae bacterium]